MKIESLTLQKYPFYVGVDKLINQLTAAATTNTGPYPPYNIVQIDDDAYAIEIALAGFDAEDVEIELHDSKLHVSTVDLPVDRDDIVDKYPAFIYRGIASRSFSRVFTLGEDIHVESTKLENGMLTINLARIVPDHKKPRKIAIGAKK